MSGHAPTRPTGHDPGPPAGLKSYDVRQERDHGRRRHLAQAARRVLRVGVLAGLDLGSGALALGAAAHATGRPAAWPELLAPALVVQVLCLFVVGAYGPGASRSDPGAPPRAMLLAAPLLGLLSIAPPRLPTTGWLLAIYAAGATAALAAQRALVQRVVLALRRRGWLVSRVLVIGSDAEAAELAAEIAALPYSDLAVVARLAPERVDEATAAGWGRLEEEIDERQVRAVLLADGVADDDAERLVARVLEAGASVLALPSRIGRAAAGIGGAVLVRAGIVELQPSRLRLPQLGMKRALDLLVACSVLLLLAPLLSVIALVVRLDSPGPAVFRQVRLGVGGRPFRIYKFRTMAPDAEAALESVAHLNQYADGRLFKAKDDPRVTRVGRVLRRTSLDELPQLLNVIRGEMSLVGPRPPLPREVDAYARDHLVRLTVTPGMTGPWQANGRNDIDSFEEVVRLEREYIRDWSLLLDLRILARTLVSVLRREGAH